MRWETLYPGDPEVVSALRCDCPKCKGASLLDHTGKWAPSFKTVFGPKGGARPAKARGIAPNPDPTTLTLTLTVTLR